MKHRNHQLKLIILLVLMSFAAVVHAAPVIYNTEASYKAALAVLGYSQVSESFESDTVWADSRNATGAAGSVPTVVSKDVRWMSNFPQNNIATGGVGGSAPSGQYAIYSLPHGITNDSPSEAACDVGDVLPEHCYQNDGLKVESFHGERLFGFGGRIDTANSGKVTFILDGVDINGNDTDNIGNWQREGEFADNWGFLGVIEQDGFLVAELREIRGKDWQQIHMFCDDFTIGMAPVDMDSDGDGIRDSLDPDPVAMDNNSCDAVGPAILGNMMIVDEVVYCASQGGVTVEGTVEVAAAGELMVITPSTMLNPGFGVGPGGRLKVYSETLPPP